MPLQPDYAQDFVNVTVANVDSFAPYVESRDDNSSDFRVRLPRVFEHVVAI